MFIIGLFQGIEKLLQRWSRIFLIDRVPSGCNAILNILAFLVRIVFFKIKRHRHIQNMTQGTIAIDAVPGFRQVSDHRMAGVDHSLTFQNARQHCGDGFADRKYNMRIACVEVGCGPLVDRFPVMQNHQAIGFCPFEQLVEGAISGRAADCFSLEILVVVCQTGPGFPGTSDPGGRDQLTNMLEAPLVVRVFPPIIQTQVIGTVNHECFRWPDLLSINCSEPVPVIRFLAEQDTTKPFIDLPGDRPLPAISDLPMVNTADGRHLHTGTTEKCLIGDI